LQNFWIVSDNNDNNDADEDKNDDENKKDDKDGDNNKDDSEKLLLSKKYLCKLFLYKFSLNTCIKIIPANI